MQIINKEEENNGKEIRKGSGTERNINERKKEWKNGKRK